MREIKFRAWDKEEDKMWFKVGITIDEHILLQLRTDDGLESLRPSRGILMQYTGLKDAKGVEIYEGDIIKVINWAPRGKKPSYSKLEVKYEKVGGGDDMVTDMIGFASYQGCEVIGNIYEHKDLLK